MNNESRTPHSLHFGYNPNRLLDNLRQALQLHSDRALSRRLKIALRVLQNIRHGKVPVAASMLLWMHEATGVSIDELRRMMGDRRTKMRPAHVLAPTRNPH